MVRELVCGNAKNGMDPAEFRCYLVAHSMGGLVCRAFLQNPKHDKANVRSVCGQVLHLRDAAQRRRLAGVNVPAWLSLFDMNNFNRRSWRSTSPSTPSTRRPIESTGCHRPVSVSTLFCMVGTNRQTTRRAGLSRTFVGHGSDGLVRIENSTLSLDIKAAPPNPARKRSPTARTRAISGSSTAKRHTRTSCASSSATCASTSGSTSTMSGCRRKCRRPRRGEDDQRAVPDRAARLAAREALVPDAPRRRGGLGRVPSRRLEHVTQGERSICRPFSSRTAPASTSAGPSPTA